MRDTGGMEMILQSTLSDPPWMSPASARLPGVQPLDPAQWVIRDDAFAAQMALRDRLITEREGDVHALVPGAEDAASEVLDLVLETLRHDAGYVVTPDHVTRPDGVRVAVDPDHPLLCVGRLIQSDICLMQAGPDGHVLTGAILCFPASWTLAQKIGRPMLAIHGPVPEYTPDLARRVQRLLDAIRVAQPMWRANWVRYSDPALYQPRREGDPHVEPTTDAAFMRSERQTLRRLPRSDAVAFGIHTRVVRMTDLDPAARAALDHRAGT